MRKLFKFIRRMIYIIILLCLIVTGWAGYTIHKYSTVSEVQEADAAIVLGCAVEDGKPTPAFRERIEEGVRLFQDNKVKYLIFTGGVGDGDEISEAMAAKEYAMDIWKVPEECILIEEKSHITEENMEYAQVIMEENDLKTALIVSDPLHMKRAMLMAEDYGITAYSCPTTTSVYDSAKSRIPFLVRESVLYVYYNVIRIFR